MLRSTRRFFCVLPRSLACSLASAKKRPCHKTQAEERGGNRARDVDTTGARDAVVGKWASKLNHDTLPVSWWCRPRKSGKWEKYGMYLPPFFIRTKYIYRGSVCLFFLFFFCVCVRVQSARQFQKRIRENMKTNVVYFVSGNHPSYFILSLFFSEKREKNIKSCWSETLKGIKKG